MLIAQAAFSVVVKYGLGADVFNLVQISQVNVCHWRYGQTLLQISTEHKGWTLCEDCGLKNVQRGSFFFLSISKGSCL